MLDARVLLPPPSAQALAAGQTAMTTQQDPSEAIFRGLLAFFDADTAAAHLEHDVVTDFRGANLERAAHANPDQLGAIDGDHLVWRRQEHDLMLELPMPRGDYLTLQALIDAHKGTEDVPQVYARSPVGVVRGTVRRSIEATNTPRAVTITIKRAQFGFKDQRAVDAPEVLVIGDRWYRLKAVVHHRGANMNSGHYTSSTLDPVTGRWAYRDDETVVADDEHFAERKNHGVMYAYELVDAAQEQPGDEVAATIPSAG
jgi:hypothetical protein